MKFVAVMLMAMVLGACVSHLPSHNPPVDDSKIFGLHGGSAPSGQGSGSGGSGSGSGSGK